MEIFEMIVMSNVLYGCVKWMENILFENEQ